MPNIPAPTTRQPNRGLILIMLFCAVIVQTAIAARKPNVVLFVVDDMGWMDSGVYGSKYYKTPNMDELATQAMRFTDAYALPLCSPSRASILSGQYSSRHGVTSASGHRPPAPAGKSRYPEKAAAHRRLIYANSKNYLDPTVTTIAEVLSDAGYRTGHLGKWHLGVMPEHRPGEHGFETTWQCAPDPGPPSYFSPYGVVPKGKPSAKQKVGNITDGPEGEYIADRLTDEAIAFVETHRDEPFFLNLWHYSVHGPWGHKEAYTTEYAKTKDLRGEQRNPIMASMLQSVDESLARILAKLDELKLANNTLFIFYSDNGGNTHSNSPGSRQMKNIKPGHPKYPSILDWKRWAGTEPPTNNAPLREGKGRIYEGGQRVPLMVRWPGKVKPGTTSNAIVGPIDLYPTILEAVGLAKPADHVIDGISFLPVLKQTGTLKRDALFTWFPHLIPAVSVRQGDWKLIRRFEPHPDYPAVRELYNLKDDIGETNNLAEKMPDKVQVLDASIDDFVTDTGALLPKPNPAYKPGATAKARAPTAGLVPKMCKISVVNSAMVVEADGRTPFLGTAQIRHAEPMKLTLRARTPSGGSFKVQWKTAKQKGFPKHDQTVGFDLAANPNWQEVSTRLAVKDKTSIIRLYVPAAAGPVEIQSIRYTDENSGELIREWTFR